MHVLNMNAVGLLKNTIFQLKNRFALKLSPRIDFLSHLQAMTIFKRLRQKVKAKLKVVEAS